MEHKKVKISKIGSIDWADLYLDGDSIRFVHNGLDISVTDDRPFAALTEIRRLLENHKIVLLVNGARKDVRPSPMLSNTYGAYVRKIGKPSLQKDIVNIFENLDDISLASSVSEQEEFHMQWVESMRNLPSPDSPGH